MFIVWDKYVKKGNDKGILQALDKDVFLNIPFLKCRWNLHLRSISPTFYAKRLLYQIPKAQKNSQVVTLF